MLTYADDIAQPDNSEEDLQIHLISGFECFKRHGHKLNLDKTEILVHNRSKITTIYLGNIKIKQVPGFKYLGTMLSENRLIDL